MKGAFEISVIQIDDFDLDLNSAIHERIENIKEKINNIKFDDIDNSIINTIICSIKYTI